MQRKLLRDGDLIILIDRKDRRYLKQLARGHRITIRGSVLRADDLIGHPEGSVVEDRERFVAFRAKPADLATLMERPAEPIFAKDAGAILARTGLGAGDRVVEVGVGAGILTAVLLRAVGPSGSLTSYEIREDFAHLARENVKRALGSTPNWRLVVGDAAECLDVRDADCAVVDVPAPERLVGPLAQSLRPGGALAVHLPTVPQVQRLRAALAASGAFAAVETLELLERPWHVEGASVRPAHRMVAHTAFLTFARRLAGPDHSAGSDGSV